MSVLLDSSFLHDGHIGDCSSSRAALDFGSGVSPSAVDSPDLAGIALVVLSNDHLTEIKFFRLQIAFSTTY